jgi:phosphoribosylanthranilate isomerase
MIRIKICGITSRKDAFAAVDAGADALGFMMHRASPRAVTPRKAREIAASLPRGTVAVGVFVSGSARSVAATADYCGFHLVQWHGGDPRPLLGAVRAPVMAAFRIGSRKDAVRAAKPSGPLPALFLLDSREKGRPGGTGRVFDWSLLAGLGFPVPFFLAGGLDRFNVATAVRKVRPFGVDVSTGVERYPGAKDPGLMRAFVREARAV